MDRREELKERSFEADGWDLCFCVCFAYSNINDNSLLMSENESNKTLRTSLNIEVNIKFLVVLYLVWRRVHHMEKLLLSFVIVLDVQGWNFYDLSFS
jgi:hypothetical protein